MKISQSDKFNFDFNSFKKSTYVLGSLVKKNIRAQYRNSSLGVLWTILNPLLNMLVMALVFGELFGRRLPAGIDYPVYVLAGNTVFGLFRMTTSTGLECMVNNYSLITKTRIPYYVFPTSNLLSAAVNFGFSFIALIIVMLIRIPQGVTFHWTILMTLVPFLPSLMMFSLGLALILATLYVRFRDVKHLYSVILTLWMYMTPLFYVPTMLGETAQNILKFNPLFHYVGYFRQIIQVGTVPDWKSHLICYGCGIIMMLIGALVFNKNKKTFILYI